MAAKPPIELAIFHLQDVCVRVQKGLRNRLRTAALEKAPQIEATFRWLRRRGIRIHLLSDFNTEQTAILLERLGWTVGPEDLIECVITNQKKCANPIQRAIELAQICDPSKTVVVVDTPELLAFAACARVQYNLGVTSGGCNYQTLQTTHYRALLDNTIQLVNYLLDHLPSLADERYNRLGPPPIA